jgi:predicted small lipoprotein YifL
MKKIVFFGLVMVLLAGCGRKGPLVAPDASIPAPVDSLRVTQKENRFFLSWAPPALDIAGKPLRDLAGFRLLRREVLPPSQDCEECADAYRIVRNVDLEYLKDTRRFDNLFVLADSGLDAGKTYQYRVTAFRKDGTESARSNPARRTLLPAPGAPQLAVRSTPTGILLQWEPPTGTAAPAGYNLYRRKSGDIASLVLLNSAPVRETQFEDRGAERGVSYVYGVRGVVTAGDEQLEGALSNEVETTRSGP